MAAAEEKYEAVVRNLILRREPVALAQVQAALQYGAEVESHTVLTKTKFSHALSRRKCAQKLSRSRSHRKCVTAKWYS
jgi:hypothetical protein